MFARRSCARCVRGREGHDVIQERRKKNVGHTWHSKRGFFWVGRRGVHVFSLSLALGCLRASRRGHGRPGHGSIGCGGDSRNEGGHVSRGAPIR